MDPLHIERLPASRKARKAVCSFRHSLDTVSWPLSRQPRATWEALDSFGQLGGDSSTTRHVAIS